MSDVELFTASDGNFFTFCSRFLNGAIIDWSDANVRELCHKMAIQSHGARCRSEEADQRAMGLAR